MQAPDRVACMRFLTNNLLLYHLHAVHDINSGRQVLPLAFHLQTLHGVDSLAAERGIARSTFDAVGAGRLDNHLAFHNLSVQRHSLQGLVVCSARRLYNLTAVEQKFADIGYASGLAVYLYISVY